MNILNKLTAKLKDPMNTSIRDGLTWGVMVGVGAAVIGIGVTALGGLTAGLVTAAVVGSVATTALAGLNWFAEAWRSGNGGSKSPTAPFTATLAASAALIAGFAITGTAPIVAPAAKASFNDACVPPSGSLDHAASQQERDAMYAYQRCLQLQQRK